MIKTVVFTENQKKESTIKLYRGKIIYYNGLSWSRFSDVPKGETCKHTINSKFKFHKLDKYDQKECGVKANYVIRNESLEFILGDGILVYLNLNIFNVFTIKWFKKEYLIQSLDFKKSILSGFIGALFGALLTFFIQKNSSTNKDPSTPPKKEVKSHLDQKNDKNFIKRDSLFIN